MIDTDDDAPRLAIPYREVKRAEIVQRCDGMWSIGVDGPGPFETREFAEAVAMERTP
jgi:hypothetical protein